MKTKEGYGQNDRFSIGDITIRRRKRYGKITERQFIKVGNGKKWILLASHLWEKAYGEIPVGLGVHHLDGNSLNDDLRNLSLVSKAQHLAIHRHEFADRALAAFIATRRRLRWSTKKKM